jgi:hypothetical protein
MAVINPNTRVIFIIPCPALARSQQTRLKPANTKTPLQQAACHAMPVS